jgi:hypothetical protein
MSVQGRIVWHDLMTRDVEKARRFYGELFAWRIKEEGHWNLIYGAEGDEHFGAVMPLDAGQPAPPHWVPYIAVQDLDAAVAAIPAAGGKLHTGKLPAGKTGTFVIAADPQGAAFTAWQYTGSDPKPEGDTPPKPGQFCWDELLTSDPAAAEAFYRKVFGFGVDRMSMPGMDYTILLRDAKRADGKPRQAAGMMKLPPGVPHPFWLSYVAVADCDASMEKARRLGATLPMPAIDLPGIGRFTTVLDPSMAAIGILGPNP